MITNLLIILTIQLLLIEVTLDASWNSNGEKHDGISLHHNGKKELVRLMNTDHYAFVKAITIAQHGTDNIVQTLYYRQENPGRKNFDLVCGDGDDYCE